MENERLSEMLEKHLSKSLFMTNKLTIGSDILCTQSECVKINVHATIEWALFPFTLLVLISFQHINSFTHANIHLASSNGYGYFNTVVFGYYYLSLNTNTCALLLVCCVHVCEGV